MSTILIPATTPPLTTVEEARATVERLEQAQREMPAREDVLNTERALNAHDARVTSLGLTSHRIRQALHQLPQLTAERTNITAWITNLTTWRDDFSTRLAELPTPEQPTREEHDERLRLQHALKVIDGGAALWNGRSAIGQLLTNKITATYPPRWGLADPWEVGFGSLPSAQERLQVVDAQLADLQAQLEAAMAEARRLLNTTT